jgi:glycosyltransferase involved in cell wall biosynthesis
MEHPLVSFIIPVRNLENLLDRCIQSILNQSYSNFEIIAVENGSTDSSWEILLSRRKSIIDRPFQLTDMLEFPQQKFRLKNIRVNMFAL